jgi:two-component system NtrC family sensor kinase
MARLSTTGGKASKAKASKAKARKASPAKGRKTVKAKTAKAKTSKAKTTKAKTAKTRRHTSPTATLHKRLSVSDLEAQLDLRTRQLDEALAQQAATADILNVISSSAADTAPVFEQILDSCERLAAFERMAIFLLGEDGQVHVGANRGGAGEALRAMFPQPLADTPMSLAFERQQILFFGDVLNNPDAPQSLRIVASRMGSFSVLVAPLLWEGRGIGAFHVSRDADATFTDREVALFKTFADQAAIAIQNARLFKEVQARTRDLSESLQQQTATADVLKVISRSTFDLQAVLETLIRSAVELSGANRGSIFLREGDVFPLKAASHTTPEFLQYWAANPPRAGRGSATHRVIASGKVEIIPDVLEDPEMEMPTGALARIRATLGVPMLRDNKVEGVLVMTRPEPGLFSKSQIDLVQTFADQAVIAVENVRLFDETQARSKELAASLEELRTAQDRLVQTDKLASLGQLTAGIAHEIKNPLNFVNNFSSLSAELIDELDEALAPAALDQKTRGEVSELTAMLKSNLEKVVQHGKRADSIVKNMLLHSREGSGEHRAADINTLVEESLNLAYHGARAEKPGFNITLTRDLDPGAGAAELYPQEITRALLNFIANGFYAAARRKSEAADANFEPALHATTKNLGETVEIRIRDNGTGIPPDVKEKMFNPFFTTKPAGEGTGLGLSMSHDIIVKQHGGRIDVETEPGVFTEFIITLPRHAAASPA